MVVIIVKFSDHLIEWVIGNPVIATNINNPICCVKSKPVFNLDTKLGEKKQCY